MKYFLIVLTFVFFLLSPDAGAANDGPKPLNFGPKETLTIISNNTQHTFSVEVADTPAQRNRGMMFRDVVPIDEGMLFEFEQRQVASIWMKNTSVFLDVLFVREDGRILKIEHSAKPYSLRSITSEAPVIAVLELAGGQANARGIMAGDLVKHRFFTR